MIMLIQTIHFFPVLLTYRTQLKCNQLELQFIIIKYSPLFWNEDDESYLKFRKLKFWIKNMNIFSFDIKLMQRNYIWYL